MRARIAASAVSNTGMIPVLPASIYRLTGTHTAAPEFVSEFNYEDTVFHHNTRKTNDTDTGHYNSCRTARYDNQA